VFILDLSAKPMIDSSVTPHTVTCIPLQNVLEGCSRPLQHLKGILVHTSGYWCLGGRIILKCVAEHFWYICLLGGWPPPSVIDIRYQRTFKNRW